MSNKPIPSRILAVLVASAAVLTVAVAVLLVLGHIFGKMGDVSGEGVLNSIAVGVSVLWAIDLICLLFALGINSLGGDS